MLVVRVGNVYSQIFGDVPERVDNILKRDLSFYKKDYVHTYAYKQGKWDGRVRLYQSGAPFYTGLLGGAVERLKQNSVPFQITDLRNRTENNCPEINWDPPDGYEERPYQDTAVEESISCTRGIMDIATGGGKTVMVADLLGRIRVKPFLFYVQSRDLMRQAMDTLRDYLHCDIGQIGDKKIEIRDVNVVMQQLAVRALHLDDQFDARAYKYDEVDLWDDDEVMPEGDMRQVADLIRNARGLYFDECIRGDSVVTTEYGLQTIEQAFLQKSRYVQTCDGNRIVMRPIRNWWKHKGRATIDISVSSGEVLSCTKNHMVLTRSGWVEAGKLKVGDQVLSASVAVEHGLKGINMAALDGMFSDISLGHEDAQGNNGALFSTTISMEPQGAPADVGKAWDSNTRHSINSSMPKEAGAITSLLSGMTSRESGASTTSLQLPKKHRQSLAPVLAIPPSFSRTIGPRTADYRQTTGFASRNGSVTRPTFCSDMGCDGGGVIILDTEKSGHQCIRDACQHLPKYTTPCTSRMSKWLRGMCLNESERLDLPGGSVMTGRSTGGICSYTQNPFRLANMRLSKSGLLTKVSEVRFAPTEPKGRTSCCCTKIACARSGNALSSTSQPACCTRWVTVTAVQESGCADVFDIEVEDLHCFFANGILVHNCHHTASATCKDVLSASERAYWRYGGTATVEREDGEDLFIQALFGRKIVEIPAAYLVKNGYLVRAGVFFVPVVTTGLQSDHYGTVYKHAVVNNEEVANTVAETSMYMASLGYANLILVTQISHGKKLQKLIPGSVFLTGKDTSKKRKSAIDDVRNGDLNILIATSLADEGLDIKRLTAVHMVGSGASITRVPQRIGRVMRPFPNKNLAIAIYYHYVTEFLSKHGNRVKRMLNHNLAYDYVQCECPGDLKGKLLQYINRHESLFDCF